jgi:hypothetical protein
VATNGARCTRAPTSSSPSLEVEIHSGLGGFIGWAAPATSEGQGARRNNASPATRSFGAAGGVCEIEFFFYFFGSAKLLETFPDWILGSVNGVQMATQDALVQRPKHSTSPARKWFALRPWPLGKNKIIIFQNALCLLMQLKCIAVENDNYCYLLLETMSCVKQCIFISRQLEQFIKYQLISGMLI